MDDTAISTPACANTNDADLAAGISATGQETPRLEGEAIDAAIQRVLRNMRERLDCLTADLIMIGQVLTGHPHAISELGLHIDWLDQEWANAAET